MSKIHLKIMTPERVVFEDSVDSISLMTTLGEITILPNHIPLVSTLRAGEMRLKDNGDESFLAVSTGLIEVGSGNRITILADSAERSEELELEAIEKAKLLAEQRLEEARGKNEIAFSDASAHLARELARHRVASKSKKYKNVGGQR
jgi:F-type H+-transporting ATPase subunit epsilon